MLDLTHPAVIDAVNKAFENNPHLLEEHFDARIAEAEAKVMEAAAQLEDAKAEVEEAVAAKEVVFPTPVVEEPAVEEEPAQEEVPAEEGTTDTQEPTAVNDIIPPTSEEPVY